MILPHCSFPKSCVRASARTVFNCTFFSAARSFAFFKAFSEKSSEVTSNPFSAKNTPFLPSPSPSIKMGEENNKLSELNVSFKN